MRGTSLHLNMQADPRRDHDKLSLIDRSCIAIVGFAIGVGLDTPGDRPNGAPAGAPGGRKLTAHEEILALRKRLPVYKYRDEFLEAVRDHQARFCGLVLLCTADWSSCSLLSMWMLV